MDLNDYRGGLAVTDGAWGTELQARGLPAGMCPDLWNRDNPQAVEAVAQSYVQAGSDVILTNTFGSNCFVLEKHAAANLSADLAEAGTAISRRAAGEGAKVFASVGPSGKILMTQEVAEEAVYEGFAVVARACANGGADAAVIESMTELQEVSLAVRAVRENTSLPVVVSLTFDSGPDKTATMMGVTPDQVVAQLAEMGVGAYGANCGLGPEDYIKVVELYRLATDAPIWVKANAGVPEFKDGVSVFPLSAEAFADFVPAMVQAGANFIGGCCGTTPEHIAAVRKAVDAL